MPRYAFRLATLLCRPGWLALALVARHGRRHGRRSASGRLNYAGGHLVSYLALAGHRSSSSDTLTTYSLTDLVDPRFHGTDPRLPAQGFRRRRA